MSILVDAEVFKSRKIMPLEDVAVCNENEMQGTIAILLVIHYQSKCRKPRAIEALFPCRTSMNIDGHWSDLPFKWRKQGSAQVSCKAIPIGILLLLKQQKNEWTRPVSDVREIFWLSKIWFKSVFGANCFTQHNKTWSLKDKSSHSRTHTFTCRFATSTSRKAFINSCSDSEEWKIISETWSP